MTLNDFTAEIEAELSWREAEIQLLAKNLLAGPANERDVLRKALVVMLYAHLEGFTKFSLLHYVTAVNHEKLTISDASYCIAAAAATALFKELRDPNKKSDYFRSKLPDDTSLHRFARDRQFMEEYEKHIASQAISLADSVVDMDSNLKPDILAKNLYRLGLPYQIGKINDSNLMTLVNIRNKIAHGEIRKGIDGARYTLCKGAFDSTTKFLKSTLISAFKQRAFMKMHSYY